MKTKTEDLYLIMKNRHKHMMQTNNSPYRIKNVRLNPTSLALCITYEEIVQVSKVSMDETMKLAKNGDESSSLYEMINRFTALHFINTNKANDLDCEYLSQIIPGLLYNLVTPRNKAIVMNNNNKSSELLSRTHNQLLQIKHFYHDMVD